MEEVLKGFVIIVVIIGVGVVLGRRRSLGPNASQALGNFVYLVATPALLFDKLTHMEPGQVFNKNFIVIVASALLTGVLFFLVYRFAAGRSTEDSVIAMLAASYSNAGNLGIPLAVYVLDDASLVIPVILFQIAFYAPVTMTWLDILHQREHTSLWKNLVVTPLKNTMVIAALSGLAFTGFGWHVPDIVAQPLTLLGGASVPLALVLFGMGLTWNAAWRKEVLAVAASKNVGHPIIAFLLASALGLHDHQLMAACILGALPTAQNVYTYALRQHTNVALARDAGLVTTVLSFPVIVVLSMIIG
ncbi:AEC family transporter [Corynebacterium vitaeruminis]|uniref:AEC family transporter n=1 Tax=Corynebacterium vitaeruminis TaxID=38305 RepID=UPI000550F54C|nr:AEC family transporter [Corynebacterium vitaeruminis]